MDKLAGLKPIEHHQLNRDNKEFVVGAIGEVNSSSDNLGATTVPDHIFAVLDQCVVKYEQSLRPETSDGLLNS